MGSQDNEQESESNANFVSFHARRFSPGRWSFLGPGSEKKWWSAYIDRPQGERDRVAELMMIKFRESGHPVFRATSPLLRRVLKSKGGGKLSIHFCADGDTIETVFRSIISVNQLSIYGAVSDLCEEYKACHVRTGRPVMVGQSDPLFVPTSSLMKTPTPSTNDFAQEDLMQKYNERMERLSQQNRVIKICTDAGFEGIPKIGPVLEVACKVNMEWTLISIESVNKDTSHSWASISHGLNNLVTDLSNKEGDDNEQETSETKTEENLHSKRMYLLLRADQRLN